MFLPTPARSAAEPAWHRRERARRGQDRLLLRLLRAKERLAGHHSAQAMVRRGRQSGHDHVLAAIADAIHASSTYKGAGKGGWAAERGRELAGRNCNACGDYNFEHRSHCRKCSAPLPPPAMGKGNPVQHHANGASGKAWGKGGGTTTKGGPGGHNYSAQGGGGAGSGSNGGGKGQDPRTAASTVTSAPAGTTTTEDGVEGQDPAERIKEIRTEEERIRKSKAQFAETNPRIVATLDAELAALASERERLQPLEVNLQAAAGRTAHARAYLAKTKEKREAAAKALREKVEALKEADKEVEEAETKLRAAEAAATAKRTEGTFAHAQDAFDFLQKDVATRCNDSAVAAQLAEALKGIAKLLAAANAGQPAGDGAKSAGDAENAATEGPQAVPGASASQRRRTDGADATPPQQQQQPQHLQQASGSLDAGGKGAANAGGAGGGDGQPGGGTGGELYAGGTVDGEITMGQSGRSNKRGAAEVEESSEDLLRQAAAALGEDEL